MKTNTTKISYYLLFILGSLLLLVPHNYYYSSSFSELYRNFDGSYINEELYEYNVMICSELQQKGGIDRNNINNNNNNVDCLQWVLTEEGNQRINEYLHFKLYG